MNEEYLKELERLSNIFAAKSRGIAYLTKDDIRQECWVFGLKAYNKWNPEVGRPGPYIRKHLENKLRNLHRDLVTRNEPPCEKCFSENYHECEKSDGVNGCRLHQRWARANSSKANLSRPGGSQGAEKHYDYKDSTEQEELQELINEKVPAIYREDYLKMLNGVKVPKERQEKIRSFLEGLQDG